MEALEVSRPTLREGLRILESEGLITVRRGSRGGARVQVPSTDVAARYAGLVLQYRGATLADVFQARVIVEAPAAGTLARQRDRTATVAALRGWVVDNPRLDGPEHAARANGFNRLVVALTGSETLVLITAMLEAICDDAISRYTAVPRADDAQLLRRAARTRTKLIGLVSDGEADGAESLWRSYLSESGKRLLASDGATVLDLVT
jgi:DNA-binding FadR family transcriptional regulator